MLPSVYLVLNKLPLLRMGKVDSHALPQSEGAACELDVSFVAPRNAIEEVLAEIFAGVMMIEQVGVNDNFFELGGQFTLSHTACFACAKGLSTGLAAEKNL